jgi:hypothetical protein
MAKLVKRKSESVNSSSITEPNQVEATPKYAAERGILLIAIGSPFYGRLAYNLATSIRLNNKTIPIAVVYTDNSLSHLNAQQQTVFNYTIECNKDYYTGKDGKFLSGLVKCNMFNLSPFKQTIFIDVDSVMFKSFDADAVFNELEFSWDIQFQNSEVIDIDKNPNAPFMCWGNVKDIINSGLDLKSNKLYVGHSYFIVFNKTDNAKAFFDESIRLYNEMYYNKIVKFVDWQGNVPDEFVFGIAGLTTGVKHKFDIRKYVFDPAGKPIRSDKEVIDHYLGLSLPGNPTASVVDLYDRYVTYAVREVYNQRNYFKWIPKSVFNINAKPVIANNKLY